MNIPIDDFASVYKTGVYYMKKRKLECYSAYNNTQLVTRNVAWYSQSEKTNKRSVSTDNVRK